MAAKTSVSRFDKLKKEIELLLLNSPNGRELVHARLTLKWVLKLKPDAGEVLMIAALSHDIERTITGITERTLKGSMNQDKYVAFKKKHSVRSAKIICKLLEKRSYPKSIINEINHLVKNHEFGGDEETGILTDSDSLAYFEHNIPSYLKGYGKNKTKKKIKFMYKRMSSRAKGLVSKIKYRDKRIASLVEQNTS